MDAPAWARRLAWLGVRATELTLALAGLTYGIVGTETGAHVALYLFCWGTVAIAYLTIGGIITRRRRFPGRRAEPVAGRRFSFLITAAASVTGLTASLDVLSSPQYEDYGPLVTGLGVLVMLCAWVLLHVGYARFYATWPGDLAFPGAQAPGIVDYLYFAVTVGVSFAVSDVEVRSRPLRWHVMVHAVISFFYNTVVLAIAVSVITQA